MPRLAFRGVNGGNCSFQRTAGGALHKNRAGFDRGETTGFQGQVRQTREPLQEGSGPEANSLSYAGVITRIDRDTGRISATLDAAAGREGRQVAWSASEFAGFRHGYAGTIYKGQGKTLDHTYLLHTQHWRAASSYVALTRQRESAKVFAAVETARDIRQLARQIGRAEIKSASIAYATADELTPAQKARAAEQAREAARATVQQSAKARPGAPARPQQPAIARTAAPRSQHHDGRAPEAAAKPIGAERTARPPAPAPAWTAPAGVLIAAFEGKGQDGIERDSLGRGVDGKSVAAIVASDAQVRRELEARSIYLQTAYRDHEAATTRLNELVARDGATSAARRLSTEPGLLGELRGREGLFAGGKGRAERQAATRAAAAIGPNVTRLSEAEAQAAQDYRASVAAQLKADRTAIPKLSEQAAAGLELVAAARTDQARAEAYRTLTADAGMKREVDAFRKSVEARFGEEGARAMARAAAAGKAFTHASVPEAQQSALDAATKLY
ncbi:MAG: BID domain-containing protein, partial [Methyloceanibacter sp.]